MFCAKCGTRNLLDQKYCRQCGHGLAAHRLALDGKVEDAAAAVKRGSDFVIIGLIVFGVSLVNLVANWIFGPEKLGIIIHLLMALLIPVPLTLIGIKLLKHSASLLNPKDQPVSPSIESVSGGRAESAVAATTDRSLSLPPAADSVTEHTTLELKTPEQAR